MRVYLRLIPELPPKSRTRSRVRRNEHITAVSICREPRKFEEIILVNFGTSAGAAMLPARTSSDEASPEHSGDEDDQPASSSESDTSSWERLCEADGCLNDADIKYEDIPDKLRQKLWPSGDFDDGPAVLCDFCAMACCVATGCCNPIERGAKERYVAKMPTLPKGVVLEGDLDWRGEPGQLCWDCANPGVAEMNQARKVLNAEASCASLDCKWARPGKPK